MLRSFSVERTVQASAILLQAEPGHRMKYIRLLKLLYVADRESMRQTGFPITGDDPYAMRKGPVLTTVLRLVNGMRDSTAAEAAAPVWDEWIQPQSDFYVGLLGDPGHKKLTRREIAILDSVAERYHGQDPWSIIEQLHQELPEWEKNYPGGNSSAAISAEDILDEVGQSNRREFIIAVGDDHQDLASLARSSSA